MALLLGIDDALLLVGTGPALARLVFASGCLWFTAAVQINTLSLLSDAVRHEWELSSAAAATVTSALFAGQILGCAVWGYVGDTLGRRRVFLASVAVTAACALLTPAAPNLPLLVLFRFGAGVGAAGIAVPYGVLVEFTPPRLRPPLLMGIWVCWSAGSVAITGMAWLTLERWGWRAFALLAAAPPVMCLAVYPVTWESPRWLLSRRRTAAAAAVLQQMASANGVALPPNGIELLPAADAAGARDAYGPAATLRELWGPEHRRVTAPLWCVWWGFGFVYYGVQMLIIRLLEEEEEGGEGGAPGDAPTYDYVNLIASAGVEALAILVSLPFMRRAGYLRVQAVEYLLCGAASLAAAAASGAGRAALFPLTLAARAAAMGASCATWACTPELYPIHIRARGQTYANAFGFVGSIAAPYVIDSDAVPDAGVGAVVLALCAACACAALVLPDVWRGGAGAVPAPAPREELGERSRLAAVPAARFDTAAPALVP